MILILVVLIVVVAILKHSLQNLSVNCLQNFQKMQKAIVKKAKHHGLSYHVDTAECIIFFALLETARIRGLGTKADIVSDAC